MSLICDYLECNFHANRVKGFIHGVNMVMASLFLLLPSVLFSWIGNMNWWINSSRVAEDGGLHMCIAGGCRYDRNGSGDHRWSGSEAMTQQHCQHRDDAASGASSRADGQQRSSEAAAKSTSQQRRRLSAAGPEMQLHVDDGDRMLAAAMAGCWDSSCGEHAAPAEQWELRAQRVAALRRRRRSSESTQQQQAVWGDAEQRRKRSSSVPPWAAAWRRDV